MNINKFFLIGLAFLISIGGIHAKNKKIKLKKETSTIKLIVDNGYGKIVKLHIDGG